MALNFRSLVEGFSLIPCPLDGHSLKKLEKDLLQSSLDFDARVYSSFCFSFALALGAVSLAFSLALSDAVAALSFSLPVFSAVFAASLYLPWFLKKRRAAEIERDLPLFLRGAAVDLSLATAFEKTLEGGASGFGALGEELARVCAEFKRGHSVQSALLRFSDRVDSIQVKRAVMQLCFSYEHGFADEEMKKLADELIQQQRVKSREFAAKQAFFGLLFIAASTIVPALFSAYVMIGSSFLSLTFTTADIVVFFVIVFPLADFAILFYLSEAKPKVL
ncbi:MAG: type II secretion system F family protein [Candidatus Norongarragalinales archaeon]